MLHYLNAMLNQHYNKIIRYYVSGIFILNSYFYFNSFCIQFTLTYPNKNSLFLSLQVYLKRHNQTYYFEFLFPFIKHNAANVNVHNKYINKSVY